MSSMRDEVLARQREGYSTDRLVVPAELPKRPLLRTARIAVVLAVLSAFGARADKVSADKTPLKNTPADAGKVGDPQPNSYLDLNTELIFFPGGLSPEISEKLKERFLKQLNLETPESMEELADWVVKAKKCELLGAEIPEDVKKKGWALIQDISRAKIKEIQKSFKTGNKMEGLAAYFHHARQFYSIYAVSPDILKNSIIRELHRIEDALNRVPTHTLLQVLNSDSRHRNSTRKAESISKSWVDEVLKANNLPRVAWLFVSAFEADTPQLWKPLASRVKQNRSFVVRGGNYYFREGNRSARSWKLKLHKHPSFFGADGYVCLENRRNPNEYRNISLNQFYSLVDSGGLAAFMSQVHQEYLSQQSPRNVKMLNQLDFPKEGKIVVLRIYPETPDPTIHKALPQGMLVSRALEEKYGDRIRRDAIRFSADPVKTLKDKIRFYKNLYKDEKGGVHFYIELNGHGYNGDLESHKGVHINGPLRAEPIIRTIHEEAKGSFAYIGTIACFGGAFIPELRELYRKHPELAKGIVVSTQAKDTEYNYIVAGDKIDGADKLWLTEFTEEFIIRLLRRDGIGRATRKADIEARKNNGCDADTMIENKHIGDAGDLSPKPPDSHGVAA